MSKALDIILAVKARLQGITVAGGYNTNAGQKVYLGRAFLDGDKDVPSLTLHEGRPQESGYGFVENTSARPNIGARLAPEYTVEGFAEADSNDPYTVGHALLADIKKALWGTECKNPLADTLTHTMVGYGIMPHQAGSNRVAVLVVGAYQYVENFAAP